MHQCRIGESLAIFKRTHETGSNTYTAYQIQQCEIAGLKQSEPETLLCYMRRLVCSLIARSASVFITLDCVFAKQCPILSVPRRWRKTVFPRTKFRCMWNHWSTWDGDHNFWVPLSVQYLRMKVLSSYLRWNGRNLSIVLSQLPRYRKLYNYYVTCQVTSLWGIECDQEREWWQMKDNTRPEKSKWMFFRAQRKVRYDVNKLRAAEVQQSIEIIPDSLLKTRPHRPLSTSLSPISGRQ